MKKLKNQLDERQERKLLEIEHNGCWLAFWGLLAVMGIQQFVLGDSWKNIVGEWIVFMCLCIYMMGACIKNGIWDRRLKPSPKVNLITSIIAGTAAGVIFSIIKYVEYHTLLGAIASGMVMFFMTAVLAYAALWFCMGLYKKRVHKLEEEDEE